MTKPTTEAAMRELRKTRGCPPTSRTVYVDMKGIITLYEQWENSTYKYILDTRQYVIADALKALGWMPPAD